MKLNCRIKHRNAQARARRLASFMALGRTGGRDFIVDEGSRFLWSSNLPSVKLGMGCSLVSMAATSELMKRGGIKIDLDKN